MDKYLFLTPRLSKIAKHLEHTKPFRNGDLIWSEKGYWYLSPMPTEEELKKYYKNNYWDDVHGGKELKIRARSIDHFLQIKSVVSKLDLKERRILNFGAGRGGTSFLFAINNWNVINVEPSPMLDFEWETVNSLDEISQRFDIIYASHSLEHVVNIDQTIGWIIEHLDENGIFYCEVPNCSVNNQIVSPHTLYFTSAFFKQLNLETILIGTYNETDNIPSTPEEDEQGESIRYIGQKILAKN